MKKRYLLFFTVLLVLFFSVGVVSSYADSREFCSIAKEAMKELNEQLPIRLDFASSMVGASAVHLMGECLITYSYLIDEQKFLEGTRESIKSQPLGKVFEPTNSELIEFANSTEGRGMFKAGVLFNAAEDLLHMARLPSVKVQMNYAFDRGNVREIQVVVE